LQPTILPEVWEKCGETTKENMNTMDIAVLDCVMMFGHGMELWTNLQEDLNFQKLNIDVRETQQKYVEV